MKAKKLLFGFAALVIFAVAYCGCKDNSDEKTEQPDYSAYSASTRELIALVEDNAQLKMLLEKAIAKGKELVPDKKLNPAQSIEEYYEFVEWAAHSMPWTVVWQPDGTDIFTRIDQSLNYFFFINDLPLDELEGQSLYNNSLQYYEPYRTWLKSFAIAWGQYLDTEDSWKQEYFDIVAKEDTFGISKGWYEDASNWKTFNQFFARELRDKDQRPIAEPENNAVVVSPADACTQGVWAIDEDGFIVQQEESGVQIKSKKFSSVAELVGPNSQYRDAFRGGTLTHSFLNVYDYHRYHFPLSGVIKEIGIIEADYAVGGQIIWNQETGRYDLFCDTPGWQSIETRGCVILETPDFGLVALLPIGMMPVTSVNFDPSLKIGTTVKKGDMLGHFLFGGSDFVLLFQKGVTFTPTPELFSHQLMGEELGRLAFDK